VPSFSSFARLDLFFDRLPPAPPRGRAPRPRPPALPGAPTTSTPPEGLTSTDAPKPVRSNAAPGCDAAALEATIARHLPAPGAYRVDGMLFHMPGYWELYFDLSREGVMERAQGAVTLE
jgi:hypothetical protein